MMAIFTIAIIITACEQEAITISDEIQDNSTAAISDRHGHIAGLGVFEPVTLQEAARLKVFIHPCFIGTDYENAIPAALEDYNASPTNLNFEIVSNIDDAHLIFRCDSGTNCGQGYGAPPVEPHATVFPSGGAIGREIVLMTSWNSCPCSPDELDQCFFEHTVLHEIFHNLGFVHNDEQEYFTYVEGTPKDDYIPGSVINSGQSEYSSGNLCTPACELAEWDVIALQDLYPCAEPTVTDITYNQSGSQIAYLFANPYDGVPHQFRYRPKSTWLQFPWQTLPATTNAYSPFFKYCARQYDVQLRVRCGSGWATGWSPVKVVGCIQ